MTVTVHFLTALLFCTVANARVQNHTCIPTSFRDLCILEYVFYQPNNTASHIFPTGYSLVRVGNKRWVQGEHSVITTFDAKLHSQLGQPAAVEMIHVHMKSLEIPLLLQQANFEGNIIESFTTEAGIEQPLLSLLDLSDNMISNITNVSSLINLESLYLASNKIHTIDRQIFEPLIKLRFLNLSRNKLVLLSLSTIPKGLTFLWLYSNEITSITFDRPTTLHSLEVLNIEQNPLKALDVSSLIQTMPRLRLVRFGETKLGHSSVLAAIDILKQHNISFSDEADEFSCYYENIEGVCVEPQLMGSGWLKAVFLSILATATAAAFVWVVWRVFLAMNK